MVVSAALQLSLVADGELSGRFCKLKNALIAIWSLIMVPFEEKDYDVDNDTNTLKSFDPDMKLESFSSSSETDDSDSESSYISESKVHCKVTKLKIS